VLIPSFSPPQGWLTISYCPTTYASIFMLSCVLKLTSRLSSSGRLLVQCRSYICNRNYDTTLIERTSHSIVYDPDKQRQPSVVSTTLLSGLTPGASRGSQTRTRNKYTRSYHVVRNSVCYDRNVILRYFSGTIERMLEKVDGLAMAWGLKHKALFGNAVGAR
jgi:hypothetical protein